MRGSSAEVPLLAVLMRTDETISCRGGKCDDKKIAQNLEPPGARSQWRLLLINIIIIN